MSFSQNKAPWHTQDPLQPEGGKVLWRDHYILCIFFFNILNLIPPKPRCSGTGDLFENFLCGLEPGAAH